MCAHSNNVWQILGHTVRILGSVCKNPNDFQTIDNKARTHMSMTHAIEEIAKLKLAPPPFKSGIITDCWGRGSCQGVRKAGLAKALAMWVGGATLGRVKV